MIDGRHHLAALAPLSLLRTQTNFEPAYMLVSSMPCSTLSHNPAPSFDRPAAAHAYPILACILGGFVIHPGSASGDHSSHPQTPRFSQLPDRYVPRRSPRLRWKTPTSASTGPPWIHDMRFPAIQYNGIYAQSIIPLSNRQRDWMVIRESSSLSYPYLTGRLPVLGHQAVLKEPLLSG